MPSPLLASPAFQFRMGCSLSWGSPPNSISNSPNINQQSTLVVGNATNQIDRCIAVNFTVTSGTPYTFNVSTGLDPSGVAAGLVHVSGFIVINQSAVGGQDMTIGGGTHPVLGATPASSLYDAQANGGVACAWAPQPGWGPVVVSTNDTITITVAAGTSVPGQLLVLGRSA